MKILLAIPVTLATVIGASQSASADTTYTFAWDYGDTSFYFANSIGLFEDTGLIDSWDADVDTFEDITVFDGASNFAHDTGQAITGHAIKAKFVIEDVSGSMNFSTTTASWTFTGHVAFSASGLVSEGSCKTSSFTVSFSGNYQAGAYSSSFTVPSLSGSGTQACSGNSSTINTDFDLGANGARLHFTKFNINPA